MKKLIKTIKNKINIKNKGKTRPIKATNGKTTNKSRCGAKTAQKPKEKAISQTSSKKKSQTIKNNSSRRQVTAITYYFK